MQNLAVLEAPSVSEIKQFVRDFIRRTGSQWHLAGPVQGVVDPQTPNRLTYLATLVDE